MGAKYFLQVPGIAGGSKDPSHPEWSDVLSFSWPTNAAPGGGGGGGGRDRVPRPSEIQVVKVQDSASAPLMQALASGRHFPTVTLEMVTDDAVTTWTFKDVYVSAFQAGPSTGDPLTDQVSFSFVEQSVTSTKRSPAAPPQGAAAPGKSGLGEQVQGGTGPLGQGEYIVKDGDCISSIAKNSGHFWETIWNEPANNELKTVRKDPNVLLEGDKVTVPDVRRKDEPGATEEHHRFRRKGEPAKFRLRLMREPDSEREDRSVEDIVTFDADGNCLSEDPEPQTEPLEDEPRANVPYLLDVDAQRFEGTTDADGFLEVAVPGNARRGRLLLYPGTEQQEEFTLELGHLAPITEIVGVKQRLANLTFDCGDRTEEMTPGLEQAITAFQVKHGMEPTGELTDDFRTALQEAHGS